MLRLGRAVAIGSLMISATAAAQDTVFEVDPGLWRFTNEFAIPGMRIDNSDTTEQCLTAELARRSLAQIINEMTGGEDGNCKIANLVDLPGKVSLDIECIADAGGVPLTSVGHMDYQYNRTSYSGVATGTITANGQSMPYTGAGNAVRLGAC